jgi:hypothetical protein
MKNSSGVVEKNNIYYNDTWGKSANTSASKANTISLKLISAPKK